LQQYHYYALNPPEFSKYWPVKRNCKADPACYNQGPPRVSINRLRHMQTGASVVLAEGTMTLPRNRPVKLDVLHHLLDRIVGMIDPSLAGSSEPETFTVEA
jgi:hypothetical protein